MINNSMKIPDDECYDFEIRHKQYDEKEINCVNNDSRCFVEKYSDYYYTLKKDSIIFSGQVNKNDVINIYDNCNINDETNCFITTTENIFKYVGMTNTNIENQKYDNYVVFFSSDIDVAIGYAEAIIKPGNGLINCFKTTKDIPLIRDDKGFMEAKDIADCFCRFPYINLQHKQPKILGRYAFYNKKEDGTDNDEFAICNPWSSLEYVGSSVMKKNNEGIHKLQKFKKIYVIQK